MAAQINAIIGSKFVKKKKKSCLATLIRDCIIPVILKFTEFH